MSIVDTLANVANTAMPQGVDWPAQLMGGQYSTWQDSIAAYRSGKANGYFSDLVIASNSVRPYMNSIGVDPMLATKAGYDIGVDTTRGVIEENRTVLEQALASKMQLTSTPIVFTGERMRALLQGHMALLYTGYLLHKTRMIFQLGWTDQAIKDHADAICRGYKQMHYLSNTGTLEPLRTSAQLQGLGAMHLGVLAVIVVGVVMVVAVIAAALVLATYLVSANTSAYLACRDMVLEKHPAAVEFCEKVTKPDASIVSSLDPMNKVKPIFDTVLFYGMIGLGVYALVTFMPMIIGQVGESKRKWKEYA